MQKTPVKVALWSGPRNVSTALMYAFAHRGDTTVFDEPLFAHFLQKTGVWRPSRDEVLQTMESDESKLFHSFKPKPNKPHLFLKNMANHIEGISLDAFKTYTPVILIRHPQKVLASYTKQIAQPTELDLGYTHQLQLIAYFKENSVPYKVIDSDNLLKNKEETIASLCAFLKLPFTETMLRWPAGAIPEDGVWAKYWYHSVHKSTGFAPYEEKEYPLPSFLKNLLKSSEEKYNQIKQYE